MKWCSKCGNQMEDDMRFCQKCGSPVMVEKQDPIEQQPDPDPAKSSLKKKKTPNKGFLAHHKAIALILLILMPYFGVIYVAIKKPFSKKANKIAFVIGLVYAVIIIASAFSPGSDLETTPASTNNVQTTDNTSNKADSVIEFKAIKDSALTKAFISACEQIGMDASKITNLKQEEDWASGPRYSFNYEGMYFRLYCNTNSTVNSINLGDTRLYLQGFEPLPVSDYIVDTSVSTNLQLLAEDAVKTQLNYPKTADFSWLDWGYGRYGDIYTVSSTVTAKNAFGVEQELPFYMEYRVNNDTATLEYFILDGVAVVGEKSVIPEIKRKELPTNTDSISDSKNNEINLVYGQPGNYGKTTQLDGDAYIWYYLPAGTYTVTSNTKKCTIFLDKNTTVKNSEGFTESVNVTTLEFSEGSGSQSLTVGENEHIFLTINANITLVPAD